MFYSRRSYSSDLIPLSNKTFILDIYHMNMSILNLNELFYEIIPSERWTIVESSLAGRARHGIDMAIDGPLRMSGPSVFYRLFM